MKDRDLRQVVRLLSQRIHYLNDELKRLREPHVDNCHCQLCSGWRSDPFIIAFKSSGGIGSGSEEMNRLLKGE